MILKILLTILFIFFTCISKGSVLHVGDGFEYKTIKSALAVAKNGDHLLIHAGTYAEGEIVINKSLQIIGEGKPVIDGKNKWQVLVIEGSNIIVEGLNIINSGYSSMYDWAGIKVINSSNIKLRNNTLTNNAAGIYLQNVINTQVNNNSITGNATGEVEAGNAIHCWKSSGLRIMNNVLTKHRDGLYFEFVSASLIQGNVSSDNYRYGIHFMFSNDDTYIHNTFGQNGSGVAVMFSKNVVMRYNRFLQNWGSAAYGILLKEIQGGAVEHNQFTSNTVGIFMEGCSNMMLAANTFSANGWAMRVQASCEKNTITGNNFFGNTFDVGTNGTMQLNNFTKNYWDKYEGYDLNKDGIGDIHYLPVSLYSMIVEKMPAASLMMRSFIVNIMDKAERLIPGITPVNLVDTIPLMKPLAL